ncbi:hypothetical protein GCM10010430_73380 [Kitasatospora cystarginea]|uniref:Secreted protein n=1 Tax=Kitasatospora cystarginea TaxID=58350 RepID=A0ABN3EXW8_9ACTN
MSLLTVLVVAAAAVGDGVVHQGAGVGVLVEECGGYANALGDAADGQPTTFPAQLADRGGDLVHPNHTVQTRALHVYLRWRNANARHPDVLAAQRKERARIRSEKGIRWGGRPLTTAA